MTRQFKIFLTACLSFGVLILAGWGIHLSARYLVSRVLTCPAPCHWDPRGGYSKCSPLTAHLEIKTTPEPRGGSAIWYRAVVKNDTCELIELDSDFFLDNKGYAESIRTGSFVRVLVVDAAGKQPPPARDSRGFKDAKSIDGEVHPYTFDPSALKPFIEDIADRRFPVELIAFPPRTEIAASPSVLAPFREVLRDVRLPGMDGTAIGTEPVHMKDPAKQFAAPPPGFRRLSEYSISKAGVYTAQLAINEKATVSRYEVAGSPFFRGLKRWLYFLSAPRSHGRIGGRTQIEVRSEKVSFVIPR
jgi:hypothetical protein